MPIETIVIKGPELNDETTRNAKQVADEISEYYKNVKRLGGEVLGSAVMRLDWDEVDRLFITADVPKQKK